MNSAQRVDNLTDEIRDEVATLQQRLRAQETENQRLQFEVASLRDPQSSVTFVGGPLDLTRRRLPVSDLRNGGEYRVPETLAMVAATYPQDLGQTLGVHRYRLLAFQTRHSYSPTWVAVSEGPDR